MKRSLDAVPMLRFGNGEVVSTLRPWTMALIWPLMMTLPLLMATDHSPFHYQILFPASWYEFDPTQIWPRPLGLSLGLVGVAIGQMWVCLFFYLYKYGYFSGGVEPLSIQHKGARPYQFPEGLVTHLAQPEGFGLLVSYLSITWMFRIMPESYYSFEGGIQFKELALCLVIQDGIQYLMHLLEHMVSAEFYKISHKPHHRFFNPRLFDAFNGSLMDTICMILTPLICTAQLVRTCNVWTYICFGSVYSCWLTLIHSEYAYPWDPFFRNLGLGTPADHHVHHKFFKFNYGHLFMWFDRLGRTYRNPQQFAPQIFNHGI